MVTHHPQLDVLTEYASGSLSLAQAACVAAHLNYCEQCTRTVTRLQQVGAAMFAMQDPAPVGDAVLDRVLARLDEEAPLHYPRAAEPKEDSTPALIQRLMRGDFTDLSWKRVTDALSTARLRTGDPQFEFSLLRIRAGGFIPTHRHQGTEMTLVLKGGFSDASGTYHRGDFLMRGSDDEHAPRALDDEDCICLAVLDAPLRFTGWQHRWMNPFLRLQAG